MKAQVLSGYDPAMKEDVWVKEMEMPQDTALLNIPAKHCCIYHNNYLIYHQTNPC